MKCSNSPSCWAVRGNFKIFFLRKLRFLSLDRLEGVNLGADGMSIILRSGSIHYPFGRGLIHLVCGPDEKGYRFLTVDEEMILRITDLEGNLVWGAEIPPFGSSC